MLEAVIEPRKGSRPRCSKCGRPGPTYDHRPERMWRFVALWAMPFFLVYRPRRVDCPRCGVCCERIPWASGKRRLCDVMRLFLTQWARRLSWREVAEIFAVSWAAMCMAPCSGRWDYGLRHRCLEGVRALGVDEIFVGRREKFWTLVYQIDEGSRRLLWVGRDRTAKTFEGFFEQFGAKFCEGIAFLCSDMWRPYLDVAAQCVPQALHILDPFHVVKRMNEAIDVIRREESRAMAAAGLDARPAHPDARTRTQLAAHDAGLRAGGRLPAFLDLCVAAVGGALSRRVVPAHDAQPPGTAQEDSAQPASAPATAAELLRDEESLSERRRGGAQQQGQTDRETLLRLPHSRSPGSRSLPCSWKTPRTGVYAQFLLSRPLLDVVLWTARANR